MKHTADEKKIYLIHIMIGKAERKIFANDALSKEKKLHIDFEKENRPENNKALNWILSTENHK